MTATPKPANPRKSCWPPERRAAQSARLRAARIWDKSTGPRSVAGKARSSINATKTGAHGAAMIMLRRALRAQAHVLRDLRQALYIFRNGLPDDLCTLLVSRIDQITAQLI